MNNISAQVSKTLFEASKVLIDQCVQGPPGALHEFRCGDDETITEIIEKVQQEVQGFYFQNEQGGPGKISVQHWLFTRSHYEVRLQLFDTQVVRCIGICFTFFET